jgi:hypothetical protein
MSKCDFCDVACGNPWCPAKKEGKEGKEGKEEDESSTD